MEETSCVKQVLGSTWEEWQEPIDFWDGWPDQVDKLKDNYAEVWAERNGLQIALQQKEAEIQKLVKVVLATFVVSTDDGPMCSWCSAVGKWYHTQGKLKADPYILHTEGCLVSEVIDKYGGRNDDI